MLAFIIWSLVAAIFIVLSRYCQKTVKPISFFANSNAPELSDYKGHNLFLSRLFLVYGVLLEIIGLPLLKMEQNSPYGILVILPTVFLSLGMMICYILMSSRYKK